MGKLAEAESQQQDPRGPVLWLGILECLATQRRYVSVNPFHKISFWMLAADPVVAGSSNGNALLDGALYRENFSLSDLTHCEMF